MLIRSQDKKSLVNLDNIESIDICGYKVDGLRTTQDEDNANVWYIAYSGYEKMLFIGHYSTEAKAIKVLDKIQDYHTNTINARCRVFQMPSDEEVEG